MAGFATYDKGGGVPGTTVYADNVDFTGVTRTNTITTNGQLLIGATTANAGGNHINVGTITSPLSTIVIGYSSPNITIDLAGGTSAIERVNVQTGTSPVVPLGGTLTLNGAVTAAGTNPVRTDGTNPNTIALEVQTSQALAAADATKIGLSNFDSSSFAVAATGFVTLSTTGVGKTITGNSGGAISPTANNWNTLGTGSITISGAGSTLTTQLTGLTNHAIQIGAGTATLTQLSVGSTGQVLQANSAADPTWSTATFPSTATSTGTILRADGTNWVATTATYPATTTSQQILYSTANNVVGQLSTANSKFPATNAAGTLAMRALSVTKQVFVASGTYTPTTGMVYCEVIIIGGGGAGGGAQATGAGQYSVGAGGGAGEYAVGNFSAATIGASQTVTIAAAATGVSGAAGNNGGTSSLGAVITALGGTGGGTGATGAVSSVAAGPGGTGGSGGDYRTMGHSGTYAIGVFAASFLFSGNGGGSQIGDGGAGNAEGAGNGAVAAGYGSGGGGAANTASLTAKTGGNATAGIVIVTEYVIN